MTRLLLVDDDPLVATALRRTLSKHDFEVVVALDARSAFTVFELFEPDVVLSDVLMPGTNGDEMLDDMRVLRPDLKGVLISGHAHGPTLRDYQLIEKPWREQELLTALAGERSNVIYL
ncbi:MAG TPA: response regulator [Myxococcales bacterium]|nr:response regulator [Myxococcales bacterium]